MYDIAVSVNPPIKNFIGETVGGTEVHHADVGGDVFRLAMEAGRHGLVHFLRQLRARRAQCKRKLNMHRVRLLDCFCQNMFVCIFAKERRSLSGRH